MSSSSIRPCSCSPGGDGTEIPPPTPSDAGVGLNLLVQGPLSTLRRVCIPHQPESPSLLIQEPHPTLARILILLCPESPSLLVQDLHPTLPTVPTLHCSESPSLPAQDSYLPRPRSPSLPAQCPHPRSRDPRPSSRCQLPPAITMPFLPAAGLSRPLGAGQGGDRPAPLCNLGQQERRAAQGWAGQRSPPGEPAI